jgi:hypothetical protein
MDPAQKRIVAFAAYAIALVLFVFFFGHAFWEWATWNPKQGTLDLGFLKVTTRPAFPDDAKSIVVGIVLPIVLVAAGRVIEGGKRA